MSTIDTKLDDVLGQLNQTIMSLEATLKDPRMLALTSTGIPTAMQTILDSLKTIENNSNNMTADQIIAAIAIATTQIQELQQEAAPTLVR